LLQGTRFKRVEWEDSGDAAADSLLNRQLEVYTVSDLEQKIAAVTKLESEVIQTAKRRTRSSAGSQLVS